MAFQGDSIGILVSSAAADAKTGRMYIKSIRWVGDATTVAGDQCIIKDTAGNILFSSIADDAYFLDVHPIDRLIDGVDVDTLDSGSVFIYLDSNFIES